jgi:hypothetical protein
MMRIGKTSRIIAVSVAVAQTINLLSERFVRLERSNALKTLKTLETNACE